MADGFLSLEEYLQTEETISKELDSIYVKSFPLWRLVRTDFRRRQLQFQSKTTYSKESLLHILRDSCISFIGLLKIIITRKKVSNIFLPHPRLFFVNGAYMDRLSDPLIDYSNVGDDYIILERSQNGEHRTPRYHQEKITYLDFIDNLARICAYIATPIIRFQYGKQLRRLFQILNEKYGLNSMQYMNLFANILSRNLMQYYFTKPIIQILKPQRVFFAPRTTYNYVTVICKENGIVSVELEHGITVGKTILYSGEYHPKIDPDFFFVFGKSNIGTQFSIPLERIRNVGFPFKNFVSTIGLTPFSGNVVLVISEPHITTILLDVVAQLAESFPQTLFHIRCHPQETINREDLNKIKEIQNIEVVDNTVESFCALSRYQYVLGENSSVMYEAMSLHKKVGRLNFGGLKVKETELIHGGFKINSVDDFEVFMTAPYSDENDSKEVYSDFNIDALTSIC